jgi:hypothetical protein
MPGYLHRDSFRNTCPHHVSHCRSSEIVTKLTRKPGSQASLPPVLVKGLYLPPVVVKDKSMPSWKKSGSAETGASMLSS